MFNYLLEFLIFAGRQDFVLFPGPVLGSWANSYFISTVPMSPCKVLKGSCFFSYLHLFHLIWMKFDMLANIKHRTWQNDFEIVTAIFLTALTNRPKLSKSVDFQVLPPSPLPPLLLPLPVQLPPPHYHPY